MAGVPGSFTRDHDWTADQGAGIKILASRHDEEDDNFASGINGAIAHNGSNAFSGNADLGSNQATNVAAGTTATAAPNIAQIQAGGLLYAADTGAADAYVIAVSPAETAYATGQIFHFKAANDNTGASTLKINALVAKDIKTQQGGDPVAGLIDATGVTSVIYDGTNFVFLGPPSEDRISIGAANTFWKSDGTDPAWAALAGVDAGMTLLGSATPSGAATVDFTTGITGTYKTYMIVCSGLLPATDNVGLWLRFSDDGGVSFEAGASDYEYAAIGSDDSASPSAQFATSNGGAAQIVLISNSVGNTSAEGVSGVIHIYNPATTATRVMVTAQMVGGDASTNFWNSNMGGCDTNLTAVDGFRIMFSSGNIASGEIRLYGLRAS